jgi:hypothetical protein
MVMPFSIPELNSFYFNNIKTSLKDGELGVAVYRSDDFTGTDIIADTISEQIKKRVYNVFYDLIQ